MAERWFSDDELREMSRPTMDRAIEALDRGDVETARHLCEEMKHEWRFLHDMMVDGIAGLISFVAIGVAATLVATIGIGALLAPGAGVETAAWWSSDGVTLSGRLFGPDDGSAGVILAHMFPSDQRAWFAFAERLGQRGYRVLTFNFRGYCPGGDAGCSQGEKTISAIWQDVEGAVAALRDMGIESVMLTGDDGRTAASVARAAVCRCGFHRLDR